MKFRIKRNIVLWVILLVPYLLAIPAIIWHFKTLEKAQNSTFIIINKADMTLSHYNYKGQLLQKSGIATGKVPGDKKKVGDMKTPEGVFGIVDIEDAATWSHDFKDSMGPIAGAFGPFFIRLNVPGQQGIGIHGTVNDNSIGARASEGCIRMHNDDLKNLVKNIRTASVVVITPGIDDNIKNVITNSLTTAKDTSRKRIKIKTVKKEIDEKK